WSNVRIELTGAQASSLAIGVTHANQQPGRLRSSQSLTGRAAATLYVYVFSWCCKLSLITLKTPPCGSLNTAKRPTFGMSVGGTYVRPPSEVAFSVVPSQSATAM